MKKKFFTILAAALPLAAIAAAGLPDFGEDGLKGLSDADRAKLAKGEIVFTGSIAAAGEEGKKGMVEAAIVFDKKPEEVWALLSRTEDQIKYLDDIEEIKVIKKTPAEDNIEFGLEVAFLDIRYRVIHKFDQANLYFHWSLDPSFDNSLNDLGGFWRFYPYGENKTLARYGSKFSGSAAIPSFIEDYFTRKNLPKLLAAVKKYVDSGGTYRR